MLLLTQLTAVKRPCISLVLTVLTVTLIVSACGPSSAPATSTPKPTTPPTAAPTMPTVVAAEKSTEIPTVAATIQASAGEATQSAQATLITFLPPAPGLEVGKDADVNKLAADGKLSNGDAQLGEGKYTVLGCIGCHSLTRVAPPTEGTYTRIMDIRLKEAANAGKTAEAYIAESVIQPNHYVVPEYAEGIMPQDFGTRLTVQDLADLVAYLKTQK